MARISLREFSLQIIRAITGDYFVLETLLQLKKQQLVSAYEPCFQQASANSDILLGSRHRFID